MENKELTPNDIYVIANDYVQAVAAFIKQSKKEATDLEIVGSIYTIINIVLDSLKNEQLQNSSQEKGITGAKGQPKQVQRTGESGGEEESPQGSSEAQQTEKN